jgi:hypothetical protein
MLQGRIVGKGRDGLALRVEKVAKLWQSNRAERTDALVGQIVRISTKAADTRLRETAAGMKVGDRVVVGVAHREGSILVAVEILKKVTEGTL